MKNPALLPIVLIVFIDVLGFTVVIPLLPFFAQDFGATPATVGVLISVYAVCALFAGPLLGRASDRYGRKPVLLVSQAGSLLGFVMLAMAPSLLWLFLGRALDGLTAGNVPTARAYISDVTAPKDRSAAFGLITAAFGFGFMIGPAGAGLLARYGHEVPLWTAAGLSGLSLLCTLFLLPGASPRSTRPSPVVAARSFLSTPDVARLLWQLFAFLLAFSLFTAGFAMFCERRFFWNGAPFGAFEVGLAFAWIGGLGLFAQLFLLRPLVKRFGEASVVRASLIGGAGAYAGLGFAHSLPLLLVSLSIVGIAISLLRPCLLGLISQHVAPDRQGAVFGLTQSLQSLALIVSPLLAGGLIHIGWLSAWGLAGASALLLALLPVAPAGQRSHHARTQGRNDDPQ